MCYRSMSSEFRGLGTRFLHTHLHNCGSKGTDTQRSYLLNVSWNCTFFLPFPSSKYLNKQRNCIHLNEIQKGLAYLFVTIPTQHTHTHARTRIYTHTHAHARESPGVQMYSLFEEEWKKENQQRQKLDSRGSWEPKRLQSPSLRVIDQTTRHLHLYACLFL